MDESIILVLHNAYKEKYEQDFDPNPKTFVAEKGALQKYIEDLSSQACGRSHLTEAQAFEIKNRILYIVKST